MEQNIKNDEPNENMFIKICIFIYTIAIILAIVICSIFHTDIYKEKSFISHYFLGQIPFWQQCILGCAIAIWTVLLCMYARYRFYWMQSFEIEVKNALGTLSLKSIFIIALFSSIGEELLFRAAIQPGLGLVATSILFGILHFPMNKQLILYPFFATLMGFILGYMTIINHGAITSAIIAHALINFINLYRLNKYSIPDLSVVNQEV